MAYPRPVGAGARDFAASKDFERQVGEWLGHYKIGNLESTDRLDWWVPGFYLDVKEKKQKLNPRWHLLPGVDEVDLFVIDELSVRKAQEHFPHAYFLLRDVPADRIFLARIDEVTGAERIRVNRTGSTGHKKGKWIMSLRNFRQLYNPGLQLMPAILDDQVSMPWKRSECLSAAGIPEI